VSLPNGDRLKYQMNGLLVYALILAFLAALVAEWDGFKRLGLSASILEFVYDHYVDLITASVVTSFVFSVALYLASFRSPSVLCAQGTFFNAPSTRARALSSPSRVLPPACLLAFVRRNETACSPPRPSSLFGLASR